MNLEQISEAVYKALKNKEYTIEFSAEQGDGFLMFNSNELDEYEAQVEFDFELDDIDKDGSLWSVDSVFTTTVYIQELVINSTKGIAKLSRNGFAQQVSIIEDDIAENLDNEFLRNSYESKYVS